MRPKRLTTLVSVRASPDEMQYLDDLAKVTGDSRSEVTRALIKAAMSDERITQAVKGVLNAKKRH